MLKLILSSLIKTSCQARDQSNLIQLLKLRAEDNVNIDSWLKRDQRKYTSPENQNEMLEIMANHVIRKIIIFESPFFTIMVDETTDVSNKH